MLACVGLLGFAMAVWPRVHVLPPDEAFDPYEPYKLPFWIQNNGNLPIYDAEILCVPKHVTFDLFRSGANVGAEITPFKFLAPEIASGDKRPFTCNTFKWFIGVGPEGRHFATPGPLFRTTAADLTVIVQFRPLWFVPWEWPPIIQIFQTQSDSSGGIYWREYRPELPRVQ